MKTKSVLLLGGGALLIGGVAYYFLNKKKTEGQALLPSGSSSQLPPSPTTPTAATPGVVAPLAPRQTMWKDRDGNIFEMTSTKQKWGYVIKVNGSIQAKSNQAEVLVLGADGYMISADNNGTLNVYKNGGWQNVIRDNKSATAEYLAKLGVQYPTGAFSGFGSAYILN